MVTADLNHRHPVDASPEIEAGLRERRELFQVFMQVYSHHRDWLRRLVNVEGDAIAALNPASMNYIQGIVTPSGAYLVSNLSTGHSQPVVSSESIWLLGRDPRQSTLAILDRQLSRCHARLQYVEGKGFMLSDAGSTNGTFVNGQPIQQPHELRDGDQICLGSLTIAFFTCTSTTIPSVPPAGLSGDEQAKSALAPSGITTLPGSAS